MTSPPRFVSIPHLGEGSAKLFMRNRDIIFTAGDATVTLVIQAYAAGNILGERQRDTPSELAP